jgi:zinc transporter ZupT
LDMYLYLYVALTFFSTLSGGLLAVRLKDQIGNLSAFASGILIAVPFFDIIPETLSQAQGVGVPVEHIMYVITFGFTFLLVMDRYLILHKRCDDEACMNERHKQGGLVGAIELSVHSFMDGFAIGLGFKVNYQLGLIIGLAVISHDFADGLNTVTVMLNSGNDLKSSLKMLLLDASTPLLGATASIFFDMPGSVLVMILPFFAGSFIYLGASDLLPEAHERNPKVTSLLLFLLGIVLIFAITNMLNIGM